MFWHSVADFLNMGGYGLYVWGSFGMAAAIVGVEMAQLRARRRRLVSGNDGSPA